MLQTNKNNIECRIHASLTHLLGDKKFMLRQTRNVYNLKLANKNGLCT